MADVEILPPARELQVAARPHLLNASRFLGGVPVGLTVKEIVREVYRRGDVPPCLQVGAVVQINGEIIPQELWGSIRPKETANVVVSTSVHGGGGGDGQKNPLAIVLSIVVVVAAIVFQQYYLIGVLEWSPAAAAVASSAFMAAGSLAISAMFPMRPPTPASLSSKTDSPSYSLAGAANRAVPFGIVPGILGRHKITPPLGAQTYTELVGSDEYLRMLFVWGHGPLAVSDIKIGDTPIADYAGVEIQTFGGWEMTEKTTLFPGVVHQEMIGATLTNAGGWVMRTSELNADELSFDVAFPRGLVEITDKGDKLTRIVNMLVQYRLKGTSTWLGVKAAIATPVTTYSFPPCFGSYTEANSGITYTPAEEARYGVYVDYTSGAVTIEPGSTGNTPGRAQVAQVAVFGDIITEVINYGGLGIAGASVSVTTPATRTITVAAGTISGDFFQYWDKSAGTVRHGYRWAVPRGQYEVRMSRVTADSTNDRVLDTLAWTALRTITNGDPITAPIPLAKTALRIKATEQLNGLIDNLSGVVTSYAPIWNGSNWDTWAPTNNPASLFRLVLVGAGSARPRTAAQIDDASLAAFYNFCAANGYQYNAVRDQQTSVWDVLADICSAARATPTLNDGKWGVIIDQAGKPVVQHFTPRNSWGFEAEKVMVDAPHAWRCRFVNELKDWAQDERIVYADGYDASNASKFESIEFPGVTHPDLVWRLGRYHIAQVKLRPETFTFSAAMEHLVCQRGDLIRVSHDVPLWGGGWARVKAITYGSGGTTVTGLTLDESVVMEAGKLYACRIRLQSGATTVASITTNPGETATLALSVALPAATGINVGDLVMFGEANRESAVLMVKSIRPGADLTAQVECVDAAPDIYTADSGAIPAYDSLITITKDPIEIPPPVPVIGGVESGTGALLVDTAGGFSPSILVSVQAVSGNVRTVTLRLRWRAVGASAWSYVDSPRDQSPIRITGVTEGERYEIQAQALSVYARESEWTESVYETVVGQAEPPGDVTGFAVDVVDGVAYASWDARTEIDVSHYRIRWSPLLSGATWRNAVDWRDRIGQATTSITGPAMVGTYLCKAVDFAGNESATAAAAITSVARIEGLNVVQTVTQAAPTFSGTGAGVYYNPAYGGLVLDAATQLYALTNLYAHADLYQSGGLLDTGTYQLGSTVDLGGVFTSRVTASLRVSLADLASNLFGSPDLFLITDLYGAPDGQAQVLLEMRTTSDNPAGTPTWGAWKPLLVGDYTARAYQFRVRLNGAPPSVTPIVTQFSAQIDMPDRVVGFNASVPASGAHITFSPAFFAVPDVGLSVKNGVEGDRYTISNLTASGFDIALTNGGAAVARQITGLAKSYGAAA